MATNTNITPLSTGYDVQVIGDHPPQLNCGICTLIIKHAMHGCTKHAFCKGCISKHIECGIRTDGDVKCPDGCNIIINPSKLEANHFADRMVNTLKTKCSNDNCPWQGDLLDLVQVHQTKCDYATQLCGNNGCIANYLNKDAAQHEEVCLFKTIKCNYCNTDVIRMNKDIHENDCLNEQVNCKYYHIGCKTQLCRKDIYHHEESHQMQHMTLVYQNLIQANNEISVLKQQNIRSNKENLLLKKKVEEVEIKTNKEVAELHQELQDLKKENNLLLMKTKSFDINHLKDNLSVARDLSEKVSLVNNDQVMIVKCKGKAFDLDAKKLSECYLDSKFDYLVDIYELNHHKDLMIKLIDNLPYHWFEYQCGSACKLYFTLVFPLVLNNIKDMDITIPGRCRITIINKELMVENLNVRYYRVHRYLWFNSYNKKLDYSQKFSLQHLHFMNSSDIFLFAPGYACLELYN